MARPANAQQQMFRTSQVHVVLVLLAFFSLACEPRVENATAQDSPVAQSQAEYDIATDLWLTRSQPRRALEHALKAVELDENNAHARHLVALLYLDFCSRDERECHLDRAEASARNALAKDEDFREAKNTLGVVLIHRAKYAEAVRVLQALSGDILYQTPENAWGNLGWAYLESGRYEQAIDALSRSVAVQPSFCVGHFRLGRAYAKRGDTGSALQAFTNAVSVEHERCKGLQAAYLERAGVLTTLGRRDEARADLKRCVELDRHNAPGRECTAILARID